MVREQRRIILEARTITITLRSVMRQNQDYMSALTPAEQHTLRKRWCDRAQELLMDVRGHAARSSLIANRVAAASGTSVPDLAVLERALDGVDHAVDEASAAVSSELDRLPG